MTPHEPRPRSSRTSIPLLVTVLVVALGLGVGGIALLHSTAPFSPARPSASATTATPAAREARSLSDEAIYARLKPSVVDVTATGDHPVDHRPEPPGAGGRGTELGTDPAGSASQIGCLPTEAGAGVPDAVAPVDSGALVDGVLCGTGAEAAGISAGDVIITADGRAVSSPDGLTSIVSACRPGSVVEITWVSPAGATRASRVRLDSGPAV